MNHAKTQKLFLRIRIDFEALFSLGLFPWHFACADLYHAANGTAGTMPPGFHARCFHDHDPNAPRLKLSELQTLHPANKVPWFYYSPMNNLEGGKIYSNGHPFPEWPA